MMNGVRTDDGIKRRTLVIKYLQNVSFHKPSIWDVHQLRTRDSLHLFGQIYADQLATLRSQSGEIPGTGAKFKYSRRTTNTRFSYHPRKDILIRRSNGVALVPYVDIITGSVLIVVENSA